jgi:hypothetical protein
MYKPPLEEKCERIPKKEENINSALLWIELNQPNSKVLEYNIIKTQH